MFTAVLLPENGSFFIIQGYNPRDFAIQRFNIVEGNQISNNRQILLGKFMARSLNKGIGDTLILSGYRFRVVGIYESSVGWEEIGGVTTLRDAQAFMGRPKKVTLIAVKLKDPQLAPKIVDRINREIPEVHVALAGEFAEQMPDMQAMDVMMAGIAFLAIVVGGLGVMNTMLMSVFERTREIGVLRALGWRRRAVLQLIIEEASLLGLIGGVCGVLVGVLLGYSYLLFPSLGDSIKPIWTPDLFFKALVISFILGLVGGGYPAYHATRLQPVEALRYE
jgi:ABC-type antimicrobial peptide transport system permease subunit